MSYHVVDPADLDSTPEYPCDRRSIAGETGLSTLAAAVYEMAPGEELAQEYHYHDQREELFYVLAGTLYVETPEREFEVPTESVFVVEPDSPIRPYNPQSAGESVRVIGVGAPQYDIANLYHPDREGQPTDNGR